MKILVFSEHVQAPYDEGIMCVAMHLARALASDHEVLALTSGGLPDEAMSLQNVDTNRMLLGVGLARSISQFRPQAIVYVPTACATVFSFARAQVLRRYAGGAPTVLLTLQPRPHSPVGRWLLRCLRPDWVVAQSRRTVASFQELGCQSALLPPAVDSERFQPVSEATKLALRHKYGLPAKSSVAVHVGHLKPKRNLLQMLALASSDQYHTVVVASTSTHQDATLAQQLRSTGVTVIDRHVTHIEEIYALSDVYLFLATDPTAAIELPLSVLEAMACNLPIVSTPFGGLADCFEAGRGFLYWNGEGELGDLVRAATSSPCDTRSLVAGRTWPVAASSLLKLVAAGAGCQ